MGLSIERNRCEFAGCGPRLLLTEQQRLPTGAMPVGVLTQKHRDLDINIAGMARPGSRDVLTRSIILTGE